MPDAADHALKSIATSGLALEFGQFPNAIRRFGPPCGDAFGLCTEKRFRLHKLKLLNEGACGKVFKGSLEGKNGKPVWFAIKRYHGTAGVPCYDAEIKRIAQTDSAASPVISKLIYKQNSLIAGGSPALKQHDHVVFCFGVVADDDHSDGALVFELCDGDLEQLLQLRKELFGSSVLPH